MIKKVGSKWVVYSKDGSKKLGTHDTKEKALKQLAVIESYKSTDKNTIQSDRQ